MSHNGPTGPLGNAISFYDAFNTQSVIEHFAMTPENKIEYVVIDYGQPGDKIAYDDLCRVAKIIPQMVVTRLLPKEITPQVAFDLLHDRKYILSGADYCRLPNLSDTYDCAGRFKGFKGIPGDVGWAPFKLEAPRIMYQQYHTDLILYPQEDSPTSSMSGIIAKGGFYDAPVHVFIVSDDPGDDIVFHYESLLRQLRGMRANLTTKVITYAQAVLAEKLPGTVFISAFKNRDAHLALWEKCQSLTRMQLQAYVHGKSDLSLDRFIELILERQLSNSERAMVLMEDNGLSGGFKRGALQFIGRQTMQDSPMIGTITLDVPNPGWEMTVPAPGKKPKGPITMPGLGERKKKGKHKTKW